MTGLTPTQEQAIQAPRTWGTLDAVPEDVERITGDYAGMRREFARSALSESGWFQRVDDMAPRRWTELPAPETRHIINIEEVIDNE